MGRRAPGTETVGACTGNRLRDRPACQRTEASGTTHQFGDNSKADWQSAVQQVKSALNAETEQQVQPLRGMYSVSDQDPQTALNRMYNDIVENQMQDYFLGLLPAGEPSIGSRGRPC